MIRRSRTKPGRPPFFFSPLWPEWAVPTFPLCRLLEIMTCLFFLFFSFFGGSQKKKQGDVFTKSPREDELLRFGYSKDNIRAQDPGAVPDADAPKKGALGAPPREEERTIQGDQ